jgi:hypothetical protein
MGDLPHIEEHHPEFPHHHAALSPTSIIGVGILLFFHFAALMFWLASVLVNSRRAAADTMRAKQH